MTRLQVLDSPADLLPGEVIATFFYSDVRPLSGPAALLDWRLDGILTEQIRSGRAQGVPGEQLLFAGNRKLFAKWVLFYGGGPWARLTPLTLSGLIGSVLEDVHRAGFHRLAIALDCFDGMDIQDAEHAVWDFLDKDRFHDMEVVLACRGPRG